MRQIRYIAACALVATGVTLAGESQSGLKVELNARQLGKKLIVRVHLANTGEKNITVLTTGLNCIRSKEGDVFEVTFGYQSSVTYEGRPVIPSLTTFSPVTLRPGEMAVISNVSSKFERLPESGKLLVTYEIAQEWGKRFNIWFGKVSCAPMSIDGGKINLGNHRKPDR